MLTSELVVETREHQIAGAPGVELAVGEDARERAIVTRGAAVDNLGAECFVKVPVRGQLSALRR